MPSDENAEHGASDVSLVQKMLSAVSGSVLTSLLVTPLDVVRVRLQSQSSKMTPAYTTTTIPSSTSPIHHFRDLPPNLGMTACCREVFWINNHAPFCVAGPTIAPTNPADAACAVQEVQKRTINSTWDGLRKIARNEGPRTLWRGLSPTLVMTVPANVIYFAGYDWLRTARQSPIRRSIPDVYTPLIAGALARVFAAVAVSPIEMFRTRMQAATHSTSAANHFQETMSGLRCMVAAEGWRSLWKGLTLTLWRDVPFSAIYWWGYEYGRVMCESLRVREQSLHSPGLDLQGPPGRLSVERHRANTTNTLLDSFAAGAASGAVAAFVTTPFDVGKTRQQIVQTRNGQNRTHVNEAWNTARAEDLSMPRLLGKIYQEQGMSGLFKGWAARCLKVAPACAIMISSYEIGKRMALDLNNRRTGESESSS